MPDWWFSCFKDIYCSCLTILLRKSLILISRNTISSTCFFFLLLPKQHIHDYKSVSFLKLCNIYYSVLSAYFIDNGNNTESLILSLIMFLVIWGFNVCYTCNWIQWQNEKLLASNPNYYYTIIIFWLIIQNSECMRKIVQNG